MLTDQVESPTGTGKSLTLLTATLTWLEAHMKRLDHELEHAMREKMAADEPDDPPWVIEHAVKARLAVLRAEKEEREERLEKAKARERKLRLANANRAFSGGGKRAKVDTTKGSLGPDIGDDQFLPEDLEPGDDGDGSHLTGEVKALMAR